jgi:spore photoproduct lyase
MMTDPSLLADRKTLVTAVQKGEFLKPCPGTAKSYFCCGYQILTPLTGCGMYCSYCVLQSYFDHQHQVVYENFWDLEKEVERKLSTWRGIMRIGTGEFADSLYQENNLGLCKKVADLLDPYPNVIVEFKTKCGSIDGLLKIKNPQKVIIGFSMNTPAMIAAFERDTAFLDKRLSMMAQCEEMGFFIGIHFDPIFHYDKWENEYRDVVRRIFMHIKDPKRIAWWSMGGFRTNPALKKILKRDKAHLPLFAQENIIFGEDGKYRYFRPIRVAFYRAIQEEIARHAPETVLYLCMENEDVWKDAGMLNRIPRGLPGYLDMRAVHMGARALDSNG